MDIVIRNFMRLLRSGAFEDKERIEPMSPWKWNLLYQLSLFHGVQALVFDGIQSRQGNDFFLNIPQDQMDRWRETTLQVEEYNKTLNANIAELLSILSRHQLRPILFKGQALSTLYPNPLHRLGVDCDIYYPYTPQADKADAWAHENGSEWNDTEKFILQYKWKSIMVENHRCIQRLTNMLLNKRLQAINDGEIRCCDSTYVYINDERIETLPPTLNMLNVIIRIARYILNDGISLRQIVDLGIMLRTIGDRIDYVKLQQWIEDLKLKRMAHLEGIILMRLFNFTEEELPFLAPQQFQPGDTIINDIFQLRDKHSNDWFFTQGENIFVTATNSSAMMWHMKHSARYFKYYPSETVTNFFASLAYSLSHIEE